MANITGTSGNDTRVGTSGMDDIINRDGDPQGFPGTRGNDVLFGYGGADFIYGGPHNDQLFGGTGNDRLFGGTGNDLLKGGVNNDLLNGGLGTDTADYSTVSIDPPGPVGPILTIGATAGVTVNLNMQGVAQNTGGAGLDMLVGIENLIGTNFNDTLTGNGAKNVLSGLDGDDTLDGRGGIDTASYATATAGVTVSLLSGSGEASGGAGNDTLVSIENLIGSKFNDRMVVDGLEDGATLNGGNGNDYIEANHNDGGILNGGADNDTLFAGNGFATLNGGTGNDHLNGGDGGVLNGGDGNDLLEAGEGVSASILNGGAGADTLYGSGGATTGHDIYDYNAVRDSPAGAVIDTIVNFFKGDENRGDLIDLSDIDANALLAGDQAFTPEQLDYVGGIFSADIIGTGPAPDLEIQLLGEPPLTLACIVL